MRKDAHDDHNPVAEQKWENVLDHECHFRIRVDKVHAQDEAHVLQDLSEQWNNDQRLPQVVPITPETPKDHQDEWDDDLK